MMMMMMIIRLILVFVQLQVLMMKLILMRHMKVFLWKIRKVSWIVIYITVFFVTDTSQINHPEKVKENETLSKQTYTSK